MTYVHYLKRWGTAWSQHKFHILLYKPTTTTYDLLPLQSSNVPTCHTPRPTHWGGGRRRRRLPSPARLASAFTRPSRSLQDSFTTTDPVFCLFLSLLPSWPCRFHLLWSPEIDVGEHRRSQGKAPPSPLLSLPHVLKSHLRLLPLFFRSPLRLFSLEEPLAEYPVTLPWITRWNMAAGEHPNPANIKFSCFKKIYIYIC